MLRIGSAFALALALAGPCAAEELLAGRVQKVTQQPSGADGCPPPCPIEPETSTDGSRRICISNGGGCEAMELKVERDFLGRRETGSAWSVSKRVGEWGSAFPVTSQLIVVHDDGTRLRWTPAIMRDGQVLVHPDRFVTVLRAVKAEWFGSDTTGMVPVEQLRLGR